MIAATQMTPAWKRRRRLLYPTSAALPIEHVADLLSKGLRRERLGHEIDAGCEHAVMHDGLVGVARHVDDLQGGPLFEQLRSPEPVHWPRASRHRSAAGRSRRGSSKSCRASSAFAAASTV